jgi:hypothetical protein
VSDPLTYVFCLLRSVRRPSIPKLPAASTLPGSRDPRAVPAGDDRWLIVATVPADGYDEAALAAGMQNLDWVGRRAIAHEAMVEQFLSAKAVLPMQLFTLFTSDERALQHVTRQRQEIAAILKRLDRKVEWGLRLTFDEQAMRAAVDATARSAKAAPTGASYLARKRDLLDVTRGQLQAAKAAADTLFARLAKDAAESRRRTATEQAAPGSRLLLDAAFLVPATRTRSFRAAVGRHAKAIGGRGVVVSLTGPWPPYNFIAPPSASARQRRTATAQQPRGKDRI